MWSWAEHSENADMEKMTVASTRVPIKVSVALGKMSSFILGRRTTKIEPTGTERTFNSVTYFYCETYSSLFTFLFIRHICAAVGCARRRSSCDCTHFSSSQFVVLTLCGPLVYQPSFFFLRCNRIMSKVGANILVHLLRSVFSN